MLEMTMFPAPLRQSVSLMVNSPISSQPMVDFASGSDISKEIDQAVTSLTQMDALKRASGSDGELLSYLDGRCFGPLPCTCTRASSEEKPCCAFMRHHGGTSVSCRG